MVVMPNPTRVIVLPETVATDGFELVYVIAPLLLVVGGTRAKSASPMILAGTEKPERTVVAWLTVRVALTVADA